MPGGSEMRQAQQVQAPADVKTSFTLWMASIVIGVLSGIIGFATTDRDKAVNTIMNNNTRGLTRDQASAAITVGLSVALVIGLILLALEIFFMFKMRAGRNWARIVLTVLGVLSILSGLSGLAQGFTVGTIFSAISLVVVIAAIVFMYKAAARAYFSTPKPQY